MIMTSTNRTQQGIATESSGGGLAFSKYTVFSFWLLFSYCARCEKRYLGLSSFTTEV